MDHEILPTAYNIDRCDRVGGVKTAIKKTPSSTLHEPNLKYDRSVLLINFYRPPDNHQQFIQLFAGFLRSLDFGYHHSVIVVGDFNLPGIPWIEGSGFASSKMQILSHLNKFFCEPHSAMVFTALIP